MTKRSWPDPKPAPKWLIYNEQGEQASPQWVDAQSTLFRWKTWLLTKGAGRATFFLTVWEIRERGVAAWRACNVPGAE